MPGKNVVKTYIENGYYHLYNRGVRQSPIFLHNPDYAYFLYLLNSYLAPEHETDPKTGLLNPMYRGGEVKLLCYCLMPNHFHLLIKQLSKNGMTRLTRQLFTSYAMHINMRYHLKGSLFQGKLRAVLIESEPYLLHLSRYIHTNPKPLLQKAAPLSSYSFSSYPNYLGILNSSWIHADEILSLFETDGARISRASERYQNFVEREDIDSISVLKDLILES
ncbi:transposase [Patescibacteria group bacterium]|nr:transposase [Patescibacteria group bacterium]